MIRPWRITDNVAEPKLFMLWRIQVSSKIGHCSMLLSLDFWHLCVVMAGECESSIGKNCFMKQNKSVIYIQHCQLWSSTGNDGKFWQWDQKTGAWISFEPGWNEQPGSLPWAQSKIQILFNLLQTLCCKCHLDQSFLLKGPLDQYLQIPR